MKAIQMAVRRPGSRKMSRIGRERVKRFVGSVLA
jgi:hypothetical protein